MSMSINLHTNRSDKFNVSAVLTSNEYVKDYVVFKIESRPQGSIDYEEVTAFTSYDQAKQIHKALSKLMKEIAEVEKRQKSELV